MERGACEATGISFDFHPSEYTFFNPYAPSLDRKNAAEGYTEKNTQVVVTALNIARNQWGDIVYARVAKAFLEKRK